jgi:hypothetical protein
MTPSILSFLAITLARLLKYPQEKDRISKLGQKFFDKNFCPGLNILILALGILEALARCDCQKRKC